MRGLEWGDYSFSTSGEGVRMSGLLFSTSGEGVRMLGLLFSTSGEGLEWWDYCFLPRVRWLYNSGTTVFLPLTRGVVLQFSTSVKGLERGEGVKGGRITLFF